MQELIADSPHPIVMQRGGLELLQNFLPKDTTNIYLITDSTVAQLCDREIRSFINNDPIVAPCGEAAKSVAVAASIWETLQTRTIDRQAMLIGLGGGCICDLTGFVAATVLRGVRFSLVPTTLLAMVDAAIGGKNGINLGQAKNFVGTFAQPILTLIDPNLLQLLPEDQIRTGMAEVIKIAIMEDRQLFDQLQDGISDVVIQKAAAHKARICAADPFDRAERLRLNYGHTFGHAVEIATNCTIPHGHAVAIGMQCAAHLSEHMGLATSSFRKQQEDTLNKYLLPTCLPPGLHGTDLLRLMRLDKKNHGGELTLVLPEQIGRGRVIRNVPASLVMTALQRAGAV